ncbi:hypothetical protein PENTCL1PPCAC_29626, partial [Pristionchus entomophagus]
SFEESNQSEVSDGSDFPKKIEDDCDSFPFTHQTTQVTSSYPFNTDYPRNESLSHSDSRLESEQKKEMWELIQRQNMQDYTTVCANLQ